MIQEFEFQFVEYHLYFIRPTLIQTQRVSIASHHFAIRKTDNYYKLQNIKKFVNKQVAHNFATAFLKVFFFEKNYQFSLNFRQLEKIDTLKALYISRKTCLFTIRKPI